VTRIFILIGLVFTAGVFFVIHTSTWWLAANVTTPPGLLYDRGQGRMLEPILAEAPEDFKEKSGYAMVAKFLPMTDKLALSQERSLAILPTWRGQIWLKEVLANEGWQVERRGLVLVATKDESLPGWRQVFGQMLTARKVAGGSWSPVAAGRHAETDWVAKRKGEDLEVLINGGIAEEGDKVDEVYLELPGEVLRAMPESLLETWDKWFIDKIGFVKTDPAILSSLVGFDSLMIKGQGDTLLIGAESETGKFFDLVEIWLAEEERRNRIETKGFRLPDGTIGFEKVPGERLKEVFQVMGPGECWQSLISDYPWRLCKDGNRAILSMDKSFVAEPVSWPEEWNGSGSEEGMMLLGKDILRPLGLEGLTSAVIKVSEAQARVYLDFD